MTFEMIKRNYDRVHRPEAKLRITVRKGLITEEQFKEITGKNY